VPDAVTPGAAAPLFDADARAETYCGEQPLLPCRLLWNITHSPEAARFVHDYRLDLWTNRLTVAVITMVIALILRRIAHRMITRITTRMAEGTKPERPRDHGQTVHEGSTALLTERRRQRAQTLGSVLRSVASIVILGTALLSALGELGLNLTPVLASASVVGVAVGFGAQSIVKDFLAGLFMLLEDQFGVGDVVDVGPAKGTVEAVTLRVTRLRDVNGVVWYIRNGEIQRVGNESQNWARAVLDIPVAYGEDTVKVKEILKSTAEELAAEPAWSQVVLEKPSVWGVQGLTGEAVVVRLVVKTAPGKQGEVARELRERVKAAFDAAGVAVAASPPA